jgi:protease-4
MRQRERQPYPALATRASWPIGRALVALAALLAMGCIQIQLPISGRGPLRETVVHGEKGPKLLMLDVSGAISGSSEPGPLGFGGRDALTARVREQLERAADDDEMAGLLLRIDSPGGTVIASEIVYGEIQRFRVETGLPVVAQLMGIAASGGYYVAMAASEVRAYPATITGSIGVILFGLNVSGLMDKVGVGDQTVTTGAFKDAGSPFRPMRPEEKAQLESVTSDLFLGFLDVVDEGRPELDRAEVERLADGRIYSARQALDAGLIDEIGDLPSAVDALKARAGIAGDARVVAYHRSGRPPTSLFAAASPPQVPSWSSASELDAWLSRLGGPAFLYLWHPGALGSGVLH